MAFENFPYTNFHEINLDWIVARVKEAYSASNPPDYPVKSVNGMTGDVIIAIPANLVQSVNGETGNVILYRNPLVQFPTTDESRWNLFRICDGDSGDARGIEFDEDGAHRIEGTRRILIYDAENQPDYPVTSVNGQTGDVRISAGVNSVNGKTGNVVTPFVNPNTDILKLDSNSNTVLWGISRDVAGGNVALYISSGAGSPQAFIRYTPTDGEAINLPLLSNADIPAEAGVVSVNGASGVVNLTGSNININNSLPLPINNKFVSLDDWLETLTNNILQENDNITWVRGSLRPYNGQTVGSNIALRTGTLPDNIVLVVSKQKEMTFRIYAYDENNAYQGIYHPETNTFAAEDSGDAYGINQIVNLQSIKKTHPEYTFKLTANLYPSGNISTNDAEYIGLYYPYSIDSQIDAEIEALQAADAAHDQQIATLQEDDTTHNQQITALQETDTTHNQQIAELQSENDTQDQQITDLYNASVTQSNQINDLYTRTGVYGIYIENVNTLPMRYPSSGTDPKIKSTNMVVSMDLYVSGVQVDDWTMTTYDGYLEISGTMNGTSSMTLYLA